MNPHDFSRAYDDLEGFYGVRKNGARKQVFWERFRSYDIGAWEHACQAWMDAEKAFPTPGAIRPLLTQWTQRHNPPAPPGEFELSPVDRAFSQAMWPAFSAYLKGRTTAAELESRMMATARDLGLNEEEFRVT